MRKAESTVVEDTKGERIELAMAPMATGPQQPTGAPAPSFPTLGVQFTGFTKTGWVPADCTIATGQQHVVAAVNSSIAIHGKAGGAPVLNQTFTVWFANVIQGAKIFDPKILYDQHADRWILVLVALKQNPNRSYFLISVSTTADPTKPWRNHIMDASKDGTTSTNNWADYPAIGVDDEALYLTANMFSWGNAFAYAKLRIIAKAALYGTGSLPFRDFVKLKNADGSMAFTIQPCHTYNAPKEQYLVNSHFPSPGTPTQNRLTIWRVDNPITQPKLSLQTIQTDPYSLPPDAQQQGGVVTVDTGDVRLLNAILRGGTLWTALTTRHDWAPNKPAAAVHWFQINPFNGKIVQQGIFGQADSHYSYPAVMPDANGNMVTVFNASGPTQFASASFAGRQSSDPLGTLRSSQLLKAGAAHYAPSATGNRWGDYSGIASDPALPRRTWLVTMFAAGPADWGTWIAEARS